MTGFTKLLLTASLLGGLAAMPAYSATGTAGAKAEASTTAPKAKTAQQERMTTCNKDAKTKDLKGDERKAFMSSCLKGETAASGKELTASQQRMKTCNADATAKGLKGDQRKAFMSTCLKAK